ncbi:MAG TPA: class I SAM-dependent methyltransferase [Candidatus Sulfotelmatobacter sp.]|nr:class I SAM-dependent methyltransferase [Candidatus Sulfotelmatobacter sp.]
MSATNSSPTSAFTVKWWDDLAAAFLHWNQRASQWIERAAGCDFSIENAYRDLVARTLEPNALVVDAGAGSRCVYANRGFRIVGADALIADLRSNPDARFKVVANLTEDLPFQPGSVDAVTACYFLEHIPDPEKFIADVARILRPGGRFFALFPCRFAPFAVLNRTVPNWLARKLLRRFIPEAHGGFPAVYSNCWPGRMREILARHRFQVHRTELCYYQSHYYAAILPVFLASLAYDLTIQALGLEFLAASACIEAVKLN